MHGLRHFVHNQVKNAYEAVAPDPKLSQFENKRVCCVLMNGLVTNDCAV